MNSIIPIPKHSVSVRPATLADLPFIDGLQNKHYKMVGYMWTKQLEGKIAAGHVLIAEEVASGQCPVASGQQERPEAPSLLTTDHRQPTTIPVGYCIGNDRYFKRDDVGIIYQMNIAPDRQRGLIGATLVKAMFDRAAWGCKLFCCWCAQDIQANHFWEAMGFVPLAFRAGSRKKRRVHIFWQRRIRAGDTTTPYWFPSQTTGGSIREDRIVLPIPPGMHWKDEMPRVLPEAEQLPVVSGQLPAPCRNQRKPRREAAVATGNSKLATISTGGLRFVFPKENVSEPKPKPKTPRVTVKNDPKLVAAARELRDRWLEKVNSGQYLPQAAGKYEVGRLPRCTEDQAPLLLPDARAA